MARIIGLDPGPKVTGWCEYEDGQVIEAAVVENSRALAQLGSRLVDNDKLAIEMVQSFGMPVGREVFETVLWVGRYLQAWEFPDQVMLVYRQDVKMHLCKSTRANDATIRQALLDRFPATGGGKTPQIGTKAQPGPLHGISSHAWSALAVAVTAEHQLEVENE